MGPSREAGVTVGEYLAMENSSPERHEYLDGVIYAMSGASPRHNLLVGNLHGMLRAGLRGRPCVMLPEGQRIFVPATGLYTYSDALVVCDGPRFHTEDPRSAPTVNAPVDRTRCTCRDHLADVAHTIGCDRCASVCFRCV
ncbi:MAG: Uma2 family endonuclease [Deltaproteobacteria bacterium]|nr:Uma2 family endonuclease [Deltaproteobacteria bacterium]